MQKKLVSELAMKSCRSTLSIQMSFFGVRRRKSFLRLLALCFCSGGGAQPRKWASERGSTAGERSCIITTMRMA
ncbi:unnamed protein product [Cladocopium goreaui]|uniref:Uncharacterized protein n=1 Tax=Cladocopium goreaui TaxID=2562237 RepID=A0A9P1CZM2_9DINO|nr:unnamed protein product [Cladocopium goreaui]